MWPLAIVADDTIQSHSEITRPVPEKPFHPGNDFKFPKSKFGRNFKRSCQSHGSIMTLVSKYWVTCFIYKSHHSESNLQVASRKEETHI